MILAYKAIGVNEWMVNNYETDSEEYVIGFYSTKELAEKAAKHKGVRKQDGKVEPIAIYESMNEESELKAHAKSKLSPEDRYILTGEIE